MHSLSSISVNTALKEELSKEWTETRGIEVVSVGIGSATASDEDEEMIKDLQKKAVYRNASMGAAALVDAQAEAMKTAAGNDGGAMVGFMGMNMASVAGGASAQNLYNMAAAAPAPTAPICRPASSAASMPPWAATFPASCARRRS